MEMVEFYLLMALFLRLQAVLCIVPRVLCSVTGDRPFLTALLVDVRVCRVRVRVAATVRPAPQSLILIPSSTKRK